MSTLQNADVDDTPDAPLEQLLEDADLDDTTHKLVSALCQRVRDLEGQVEDANTKANRSQERVLTLREQLTQAEDTIDELHEEIETVSSEVTALDKRTELLSQVQQTGRLAPEKRAAIFIQTLYNRAWARKQKDTKDKPAASMDYKGAENALGKEISRDCIYRSFRKAADAVDSNVVQFKKEERNSAKNTRLIVDLSEGSMPELVAGVELDDPEGQT